jgi:hypothetical protein
MCECENKYSFIGIDVREPARSHCSRRKVKSLVGKGQSKTERSGGKLNEFMATRKDLMF